MLLKNDYIVINIGRLTFSSMVTGRSCFTLNPEAIIGWSDGVNVRRDTTPRPSRWGDFNERGYKDSRLISISGTAIAQTPEELHQMRDEFMGILSDGTYEEITVSNSFGSRSAFVSLEGPNSWIQQIDTAATWKMDLYAADPRLYGPLKRIQITDNSSSGGMNLPIMYPVKFFGPPKIRANVVENSGNVDSWPTFIVTGDFYSGFEISNNNSKFVRFTGLVTRSAPVTIDMAAGTAIQGGVDKSTYLTRRDWFSIPAQSSIEPIFTPLQDAFGWCDIIYRDTWI